MINVDLPDPPPAGQLVESRRFAERVAEALHRFADLSADHSRDLDRTRAHIEGSWSAATRVAADLMRVGDDAIEGRS